MKNITKRAYVIYALICAFFIGLGILMYSFIAHGGEWASNRINRHVFTNRQLTNAGTIYDCNMKVLAQTKNGERVFSDDYDTRV